MSNDTALRAAIAEAMKREEFGASANFDPIAMRYPPAKDNGDRNRRSDKELVSKPITRPEREHSHYFKDVSKLTEIDVYRVCALFGVDDPSGATHHAIKKLLLSGKRGVKTQERDIREAIDTMNRRLQMIAEDCN